jgi:Fur family transcriptional regulator, ferric uptake regulator
MPPSSIHHAEDLIRAAAHRVTPSRVRVLAALLGAEHPLCHQELADALEQAAHIDRVTLYRVLEWLTENKLAHRVLGEDRAWRYGVQDSHSAQQHAHFKCHDCGLVFCLDELNTAYAVSVPPGYQAKEIELTIKGRCATCSSH